MMSMKYLLLVLAVFHMILDTDHVLALREFRLYSNRYKYVDLLYQPFHLRLMQ